MLGCVCVADVHRAGGRSCRRVGLRGARHGRRVRRQSADDRRGVPRQARAHTLRRRRHRPPSQRGRALYDRQLPVLGQLPAGRRSPSARQPHAADARPPLQQSVSSRSFPVRPSSHRPTRPDSTRLNPTRPDPSTSDPTRPDKTQPDPTRPNSTRPNPTRPDVTRPDQTQNCRVGSGRAL